MLRRTHMRSQGCTEHRLQGVPPPNRAATERAALVYHAILCNLL